MSKIFVLGIEGLDYDLVQQWKEGLPNLRKIQEKYIFGRIKSEINPTRAMDWISILTGQNPGKFGIWDSFYRDGKDYNFDKSVDYNAIEVDSLPSVLPGNGMILSLINFPFTSPVPGIQSGYCITDSTSERSIEDSIYPSELANDPEFKELFDRYIETIENRGSLENILNTESSLLDIAEYFIKTKKYWDCIFTVLSGIYNNPSIFFSGEESLDNLRSYYKFLDAKVGQIAEKIGDDSYLMIFSPHSLRKSGGVFNIARWLIDNKYMTLKKYPDKTEDLDTSIIDWDKTKIWPVGNSGQLYINLAGREKQGTIKDLDQYNRLVEELSGKLEKLSDDKGVSLKINVIRRHGLHYGPKEDLGPDLFLNTSASAYKVISKIGGKPDNKYFGDPGEQDDAIASGLAGYFALSGPYIKRKDNVLEMSVSKLTPTIIDILRDESHLSDVYLNADALELTETIKGILSYPEKYKMDKSILREYIVKEGEKEKTEEDMVTSRLEFMGY